LEKILK
jgi:hypothetical protein